MIRHPDAVVAKPDTAVCQLTLTFRVNDDCVVNRSLAPLVSCYTQCEDRMKYQPGGMVAKIPMPMVSTKKPPKNQAILFMMFSRQSFVIKQAQTINRAHTGAAV